MAATKKKKTSGNTGKNTKKKTSSGKKNTGSTRKSSGSAGSRSKASTAAKSGSKSAKNSRSSTSAGMNRELYMMILVILGILLFLADLNKLGTPGAFLHSLQFGLFGTFAYVFPVALVIIGGYILFSGGEGYFWDPRKVASAVILFWSICGLAGLMGGCASEENYTLVQCYQNGATGINGGVFGGILFLNLRNWLTELGAYVVMAGILILSFMYLTEMEFFAPAGNKVKQFHDQAPERRDYREQKRMEKAERARQRQEAAARRAAEIDRLRSEETEDGSARRVDLHHKSLVMPDLKNEEDTTVTEETAALKAKEEDISHNNRKKKNRKGITAEEMSSGTSPVTDSAQTKVNRRTLSTQDELARLDRERAGNDEPSTEGLRYQADPMPEEQEDLSHLVISGLSSGIPDLEREPETVQEEMPLEADPFEDDVEEGTGLPETAVKAAPKVEVLHHPAEVDASVEESMSAYDDFETADPNAVLRGEGAAAEPAGRKSAWGSGSIWETEGNHGNNAGKTFGGSRSASGEKVRPAEEQKEEVIQVEAPVIRREYKYPPLSLLKSAEQSRGTSEEKLKQTARKLQTTLKNFGVEVTIREISCGPTVTRYELEPAQGVKVRRIVDLADDLKLNLEATDIRIEAPIPGKAAVGIEVPNEVKQMVTLKEMFSSDAAQTMASKVGFAVGKDIGGKAIFADLAKMPHLLIAGSTGSGKSVCINTLIMSILYKADPSEVRLIMIDPKVVELSIYNGIPHLLIPVVTDPKKAAGALNWAVTEMTNRYKKFADTGCRDIRGYNKRVEDSDDPNMTKMPQIVVIVDELADLMMVAANEVEEAICRLAQLARAAGIHLVLATQRPSVNVITGLIKANVPSRIAFAVSSGVDSRTIIDMNGAEKLLGNGDMLFYPSGYPKPVRIQGAFVSDAEVQSIVDFLKAQTDGEAPESDDIQKQINASSLDGGSASGERDELFEKAGRFIIDKDKASIGNLQRAFRIGFNRAARIMDQLCDYGVVGPEEGTKARQILMSPEQFDELLERM